MADIGPEPEASQPPKSGANNHPVVSNPMFCTTLRCSNTLMNMPYHASNATCIMCTLGLAPCQTVTCNFRAKTSRSPFCFVCDPPPVLNICATASCTNVVHSIDDSMCCLCLTSCFPCSTDGCPGRSTPGDDGLCAKCVRQKDKPHTTYNPKRTHMCDNALFG